MILCDFYKYGHAVQYPKNTEVIFDTWTPRDSRIKGIDKVVAFGFQGFIKEYLIDYFNEMFFKKSEDEVVREFERFVKYSLGLEPNSDHIRKVHRIGYLPLEIRAVEEGTEVPIRCPMLTIRNTHPDGYWLVGFLETLMSTELWQPSTSATIAKQYRKILDGWAEKTSSIPDFVAFQGHDFSMRGMGGLYAAAKSGAGHLTSFTGTDTIPAISYLEKFYNSNIEMELTGSSIPATEHSVMEAHGTNELDSYRYLINEVYPSGFVSIVSDTWDLWSVLTKVIAELKDDIMRRDGKVVVRPDSGDPVKIICGDPESDNPNAQKGVVEILWELFGGTVNSKGYRELDSHIGAIYGDSITLERANTICKLLAKKGFASTNVVFGIGSYTYQYVTRDTFGFALKATYGVFGGEEQLLYKDPITDNGVKKSQKGLVAVIDNGGDLVYVDQLYKAKYDALEDSNMLKPLFRDGKLLRETSLKEIRNKLK